MCVCVCVYVCVRATMSSSANLEGWRILLVLGILAGLVQLQLSQLGAEAIRRHEPGIQPELKQALLAQAATTPDQTKQAQMSGGEG